MNCENTGKTKEKSKPIVGSYSKMNICCVSCIVNALFPTPPEIVKNESTRFCQRRNPKTCTTFKKSFCLTFSNHDNFVQIIFVCHLRVEVEQTEKRTDGVSTIYNLTRVNRLSSRATELDHAFFFWKKIKNIKLVNHQYFYCKGLFVLIELTPLSFAKTAHSLTLHYSKIWSQIVVQLHFRT
jgi:hypothetical protein